MVRSQVLSIGILPLVYGVIFGWQGKPARCMLNRIMELVSDACETAITSLPPSPKKRPSLAERIERHQGRFLTLFTVIYFAGAVCAASRKYFFFDEIVTSYLADLPHIGQIWPLIAQGIELNPPLPFWLTWAIQHAIAGGEVTSRIPAMFGFWLLCFCLYWFVRRRCGVKFGVVALLLPLFTYPAWDSAVARGYGLMLGMAGMALLSWQVAADGGRRKIALTGLATGIAGAVSCHYYAVYVAGAIGFGEMVRTMRRKKGDAPVWIALMAGLSPLAAYAELVRSASAGASKNFWVSALPRFIYDSYADLLGPTAMIFILLLVFLLWPSREDATSEGGSSEIRWAPSAFGRHEISACSLLVAMPFVLYLAAIFVHIPFYTRYVQPVVIGFTVIMAGFAYRIGSNSSRFQNLLISLMVWFCLLPWVVWQSCKVIAGRPPREYVQMRPRLPLDSNLPIVFDSEADFMEFYYYGSPDLRSKIYTLLNYEAALRFRGSDTAQRTLAVAQTMRELHAVDYRKFLAANHEFLVIRLREEGWVVQSLLADGAEVKVVSLMKDLGYYVESTTVYHVVIPGPVR